MHPYEMHQLLLERHFDELIKVKAGSLYHAVNRLELNQLIEAACTEREGNRPERTTYRLNPSGQQAVRSWVRDQLATPATEYPAYPYALNEAHNLTDVEASAALRERCSELSARLATVEQVLASRADTPEIYLIGGQRKAELIRAELQWTRELVARIERKDFPWDPHK